MKRYLILEDGTVFPGDALGASINATGALSLFTGDSGYQETITNDHYAGQIIAFSYPQQGTIGINRDDYEAIDPSIKGMVIDEYYPQTTHWQAQMTLDAYLKSKRIPGLMHVDTRRLARHLARHGDMKASLMDTHDEHAHDQIKALVISDNQVSQISTKQAYPSPNIGKNVVVLDLGLKNAVLRELSKRQCNLTVLPFDSQLETIETLAPDGILISNGPGRPEALKQTIDTVRQLQGRYPIFGIGLGFAVIALANEVSLNRRRYAQHRLNLAVREKITQTVDFVSQNSQYELTTLPPNAALFATHVAVNHSEIVGFRHRHLPIFAVNFDPEAAPGPRDSVHFFDDFIELMDANSARRRRNDHD